MPRKEVPYKKLVSLSVNQKPRSEPAKKRHPDWMVDPNILPRICKGIEAGLHPDEAAVKAGINWRTFERWRQLGRMGLEDYVDLENMIRGAEAECTERWVTQIEKAGMVGVGDKDPDWHALDKLLEKRMKQWRTKVEVTSPAETDSEARRLLDHVRKIVGDETTEIIVRSFLGEGNQGVPGTETVSET